MHIANGFINGPMCVVTSGLAAASLVWAVQKARQSATPDALKRLPLVAATIFAGQMVNFAVGGGASGHLMGGALATMLLGPALAVIAMGAVILTQCLLLGDGGVSALGANFLSMGVVGVLVADLVWNTLRNRAGATWMTAGIASWVSVLAASATCTVVLVVSGTGSASFASEMLASHSLIGIGEAGMTMGAMLAIRFAATTRRQMATLSGITLLLFALIPVASSLPDGLEAALTGAAHEGVFATGLIMSLLTVAVGVWVCLKSDREPALQRIRR